jgi:hypothetical protein
MDRNEMTHSPDRSRQQLQANGMDFDVYGPASVRHDDNFTIAFSDIEKISVMQEGEEKKFKLYGNSSYFNEELLASGCGKIRL